MEQSNNMEFPTRKSSKLDRKKSGSDAMIRDYVFDKKRALEKKCCIVSPGKHVFLTLISNLLFMFFKVKVKSMYVKDILYSFRKRFKLRMRLVRRETDLSPPVKYFLLIVPMRCFFCGSFMLFLSCFCYASVHVCLLMPCGHLLEKG